ncbi:MAG: DegT/DnrJ/EryC1/StrS aminotransferase family protein [Patescibacteria group bacterium]|mgnify:CR=1 FL=1
MIKLIKSTFLNESEVKKKLVEFIVKTEILSMGKECQEFEESFTKYQERKYAVLVNSGSSANLALIQSLLNLGRLKKSDLIGFSALTWSTNTMPLLQLGLNPIPIDVEIDTLNICSKTLLKTLKKYKLQALFITNLLGFCDDIDKIQQICKKNKVLLIEDNCESLGTVYKGKKLGNFSLASTCSFYVAHHLSTIEGGIICTDDKQLANMLKIVRAHGWDRNLDQESQKILRINNKVSDFYAKYTFYDLGYNIRPTEITGFLGNCQIGFIDQANKKREQNFFKLAKVIYSQTDKYYPMRFNHIEFLSNFAVPVVCKSKRILKDLLKRSADIIEVRPIEGGDMTEQPFFQKYLTNVNKNLVNPNARVIHNQGLFFGNNPDLTKKELKTIINIFSNN